MGAEVKEDMGRHGTEMDLVELLHCHQGSPVGPGGGIVTCIT